MHLAMYINKLRLPNSRPTLALYVGLRYRLYSIIEICNSYHILLAIWSWDRGRRSLDRSRRSCSRGRRSLDRGRKSWCRWIRVMEEMPENLENSLQLTACRRFISVEAIIEIFL